jgi:succinylarginine dihydrolase
VLEQTAKEAPILLSACSSASAMWAANAATVCPSADAADGRVHFTPANLASHLHRSLEAETTARALRTLFPQGARFVHHAALPGGPHFADEGAANHLRLAPSHGRPGLQVFTYGRSAFSPGKSAPRAFPARQTLEACRAVSRLHGLNPGRVLFLRQRARLIDAGVFHTDVIAVANENVLFCHEAFLEEPDSRRALVSASEAAVGERLLLLSVDEARLTVTEAVASYLFNSQLLTLPEGGMLLLAPAECEESRPVREVLQELVGGENPIGEVAYVEVRQSMRNGGGPACLRLRVPLTDEELRAVHRPALLSPALYERLAGWVERHYRDRLSPKDLVDPQLLEESRRALDELTQLLELGAFYPFQRTP